MSIINDECGINGLIGPISIEKTEKIMEQMNNCICKIEGKTLGTGFLCKVKYHENIIKILITNSHILDNEFIKLNKNVKISANSGRNKIILNIDENDILYFSQINIYNIIIIKIKEDIKIDNYLEFDESILINSSEKLYENKLIYIFNFDECYKPSVSYCYGLSKIENNNSLNNTYINSYSSFGPILDLNSNKVIGIHKGMNLIKDFNIGIFLKEQLNDIYKLNNITFNEELKIQEIKFNKEFKNNEIKIELKVDREDVNKNIYFLDNTIFNSYLTELNESNVELFINEQKYEFKKFLIPKKEGIYKVKLSLNTSIKDCSHMFYGCKNIINIDLSSLSSENISNMSFMFFDCINLENINMTLFNTSNVINMESMFENCVNIKYLDLSSFDTKNVNNMIYMFSGCKNLINLNISSFDFKNVMNKDLMFYECNNLNSMKIIS